MTIEIRSRLDYWKTKLHDTVDAKIVAVIDSFDNELEASDYAPNTRSTYFSVLYKFFKFVNKPLVEITKDDLVQYLKSSKEEGLKRSTRKSEYRYISRFFKWYNPKLDMKITFPRATKEIDLPDWTEKLPTMDEIEKLIAHCTHARDRALIAILVESGARISEVLRMTYGDIQINDTYLRVSLRGRKTKRAIPVIWGAKYIVQWLDQHPTKQEKDALWTRKYKGGHLSYNGFYDFLWRLCKRAGVKHIHPHLWRHLKATLFAENPHLSTEVKKAFLGHSLHSNIFEKRYVHLTQQKVIDKVLASYGIKNGEEKPPQLKLEKCPRCDAPIATSDKYCSSCWFILDEEEALKRKEQNEMIQKQQEEIDLLKRELREMGKYYEEIKELRKLLLR